MTRWLFLPLVLLGCRAESDAASERAKVAFERYRRPDLLVEALHLRGDERVVDIGAGDGFLTIPIATELRSGGRILATDIDRRALDALRSRIVPGLGDRIEVQLTSADDPELGVRAFDLILLSEVDHLLPDRAGYLSRLRTRLADGGRIAISNKRSDRERLVAAAGRAGLQLLGEFDRLPAHFLVFFGDHR